MSFRLEDIIATPGYAPKEWQAKAPREAYNPFRPTVRNSEELQRVLALPRRAMELDGTPRAEAIIDAETERYALATEACKCATINPERHAAEGCITRLRLVQALILREIRINGGLLGPVTVGYGKTLCDLLAPHAFAAYADIPEVLCVLFVPPGLVKQLADDYAYVGQHFRMPTIVYQGSPHLDKGSPGGPRLQVMPYSRLQRSEHTSWLRIVQPYAIIADEAHRLRNANTSTTSRVLNYFEEYPETRMAAWSGSLTSRSIRDYSHISKMCLKLGSPLPTNYEDTEDWARAIDPMPKGVDPADPGPLLDGLVETGCCKPGESLHTGIRRRITETLGVVATTAPAVDCELAITERKAPEVPQQIKELITQALGFVRPDGEEFVTGMQAVECAIQIACGFHYKWIYPKCEFPRDTMLVLEWLDARRSWHQELRQKLKRREEHLDSPQLCEYAAQRAYGLRPVHKGLPQWASKTYQDWYAIKGKVEPKTISVRLNDYLVKDAAEWAHSHKGVVWYQHAAFGEWLAEVSELPLFGAGPDAKLALLGDSAKGIPGERGERSVICSVRAHGTGTNGLQFFFNEQLFGTSLADPSAYEQALGRLHRTGQRAKVVKADIYLHTAQLRKHVLSALRAALYIEGTLPGTQKLTVGFDLGKWDELESEGDTE